MQNPYYSSLSDYAHLWGSSAMKSARTCPLRHNRGLYRMPYSLNLVAHFIIQLTDSACVVWVVMVDFPKPLFGELKSRYRVFWQQLSTSRPFVSLGNILFQNLSKLCSCNRRVFTHYFDYAETIRRWQQNLTRSGICTFFLRPQDYLELVVLCDTTWWPQRCPHIHPSNQTLLPPEVCWKMGGVYLWTMLWTNLRWPEDQLSIVSPSCW